MNKTFLAITVLFITFVYTHASHSDEINYARPAWYISGAGSFNIHLFKTADNDVAEEIVDLDEAWGFDIKIGRRLFKYMSIEAEYEYVDGFDFSIFDVEVLSLEANTLTGNLKFHYPINRFIPYITGGIGGTWYRTKNETGIGVGFESETALAGRAGAGFDLFINKHVALNANYTIVLSTFDLTSPTERENISNVNYGAAQVGLAFYF